MHMVFVAEVLSPWLFSLFNSGELPSPKLSSLKLPSPKHFPAIRTLTRDALCNYVTTFLFHTGNSGFTEITILHQLGCG